MTWTSRSRPSMGIDRARAYGSHRPSKTIPGCLTDVASAQQNGTTYQPEKRSNRAYRIAVTGARGLIGIAPQAAYSPLLLKYFQYAAETMNMRRKRIHESAAACPIWNSW